MFGVLAEESASEAQVEDMAAWVSERSAAKIAERLERRGGRLIPEDLAKRKNWDARRELATIWRDYRAWAKRSRAGQGKRIYLPQPGR
jgi:hypothetical protein